MSLTSAIAALLLIGAIKSEPDAIPPLRPPRAELAPSAMKKERWPWLVALGAAGVAVTLAWPRRVRVVAGEPAIARAKRELAKCSDAATMADVLRRYAGSAFELPGQGQTGEEIVAHLAHHPRWQPELAARLAAFFSAVETVKFASAQRGTGAPPVLTATDDGQAGCLSHHDRRGACPTSTATTYADQLRCEAGALLADLEALRAP